VKIYCIKDVRKMSDNGSRFTRLTKIFLILALAAFLLGNAFALFIYYAFRSELPSYNAGIIQKNPIASMAYLGSMLAQVVGCTVTAVIGNALSILFSSFSISFSSKAARACCQPHNTVKTISVILLIVSIIALILTLPTYFLLSFFLGI
jgi:hypothetical protein